MVVCPHFARFLKCARFTGPVSSFIRHQTTLTNSETIKNLLSPDLVNKYVEIKGWIKALRKHKNVTFMNVCDGSHPHPVQVVLSSSQLWPELSCESSVKVIGKLIESQSRGQDFEVLAENVTVLGPCDIEKYPFRPKKTYGQDYIRQYLHFRPRTKDFSAVMRMRSALLFSMHNFFQKEGYFHVQTPVITSNDCEGGGEVFLVTPSKKKQEANKKTFSAESSPEEDHFFGKPAFLTVSSQLHLEAVAMSLSKVYTISPAFRAENANTRRHVCEFCMVEVEEAFVDTLDHLLELTESLVKHSLKAVWNLNKDDFHLLAKDAPSGHLESLSKVIQMPFVRMTYTEAVQLLQKHSEKFKESIQWGNDFSSEHEQFLVKYCENMPLFVTHFASCTRPFYMKQDKSGKLAQGFDLLVPLGGEICGGSLREDSYEVLKERLNSLDLLEPLKWYLDLREYGSVAHGGFGLGFDRLLQYILGVHNIKDVVPFPRWSRHCQT